jgi:uncharacterized protein (TIGR00369 family)
MAATSFRRRLTGLLWRSRHVRLYIARAFFSVIPHGRRIGLRIVDAERRAIVAALPYADELVGDPATGAVHPGAITALIDQVSGAAASLATNPPNLVATLDLRLDHLRAPLAGRTIVARAESYRVTRHIVFVRCVAHQGDLEQPIAIGVSSFMRNGELPLSASKMLLHRLRRRKKAG